MTGYPASFAQERIWLATEIEPHTALYNVLSQVRVQAGTAGDVLDAFAAVVARHGALRTSLRLVDGRLEQVVHEHVPVHIERHDVTAAPDPEAAATAMATRLMAVGIPLDQPPPWRAALLRLGARDWSLVLVVHHAAFDGASFQVVQHELTELCTARTEARPAVLPVLGTSYVDFARGQRERLDSPAGRTGTAWWRDRLAGLPLVHSVPTDRPRPRRLTYAGAEVRLPIPERVGAAAAELAQQASVTPFTVVLAAYAALIGRYSGSADVAIGLTVSERDRPELTALVGMLVNQVVVRLDLDGDPTFRELLGRVRETVLDATQHAHVPFQSVVDAVLDAREPAVQPLYQLGFNYIPDTGIERVVATAARDDLELTVAKRELRLRYRTDLFERAGAVGFARRYLRLLQAAVADPALRVGELPLLAEAERARVLRQWSDGGPAPVPAGTLHDLVVEQAAARPDATAVRHGTSRLTYGELVERSGGMAQHLRTLGVGRGSRVAVLGPPTTGTVAGLLGVLAAGAAYVPLDADLPPERLAFVLADAAVEVALTTGDPAVPGSVRRLALDGDDRWWAGRPSHPPDRVLLDDPAYLIYTSGSTGRPKGVVVDHRAVVTYLQWARHAYPGLTGESLLHTSIAFDLAVTPLLGPLVAGGSVRIGQLTDTREHSDPTTFLKVTPSHLALLAELPATVSPTVDLVVGGEALTAEALREWRRRHPAVAVTNEYGPTEATVGCVAARIAPGEPLPPGPVRIGRPLPGTHVHVLDERGRPVPAGVAGELHVAGPQLAAGYHNRPDLTADAFVDSPVTGARSYRTGDLVRFDDTGVLHYLGRRDEQFKVRGHRVEPGEIEVVLRRQPGVRDAAVVRREDDPGQPRLVAYVVGAPDTGLRDALRSTLRSILPAYLVPDDLVAVDDLPRTPAGKLDRGRLPAPTRPSTTAGRSEPVGAAEELVVDVFTRLLPVERVGVEDDFFVMGGNSLLGLRTLAAIRATSQVELPLRDLFEHPTAAGLAQRLEQRLAEELEQLTDDEVAALLADGGER